MIATSMIATLTSLQFMSLQLLGASASSLLAGLLLCGALRLALRRWPALAGQRAVWLLALGVVGAVFALALAPRSAAWSVVPPLSLGDGAQLALAVPVLEAASAPAPAAVSTASTASTASLASAASTVQSGADWMPWLPTVWLALYLAGLLLALWRLERARRFWRVLLAASERMTPRQLERHPAFHCAQLLDMARGGLQVRQTGAAVSPMLAGLLRPCLLLPRHLDNFSVEQQQMIVEHELTHWRRRDPLCQALALLLQTALWFNPALRWLATRLSWAQELSCDRQVLAGRPARQRQHYAAALVQQLKLQTAASAVLPAGLAGLAFGGAGAGMLERVKLMRHSGAARLSAAGKCALGAGMAALLALSVLLQPAFAWHQEIPGVPGVPDTAAIAATTARPSLPAAPAEVWRYPLDQVRVNSFYGVVSRLRPAGHKGIDFGAPTGTPVRATASGTVREAGRDERLGNFIVLEHAGQQRSLYAHLDTMAVGKGQAVGAGHVIGTVGETGLATGPHLHLEAFQGERRIDPQLLLSSLDGMAGKSALRARAALRAQARMQGQTPGQTPGQTLGH